MIQKRTIFSCDACRTELVIEADLPSVEYRKWFALSPVGDHAAVRHLCSKECLIRFAEEVGDGRFPMMLPERT